MKAALALAAALAVACLSAPVSAQKSYGPGVTDAEIKIGWQPTRFLASGCANKATVRQRILRDARLRGLLWMRAECAAAGSTGANAA